MEEFTRSNTISSEPRSPVPVECVAATVNNPFMRLIYLYHCHMTWCAFTNFNMVIFRAKAQSRFVVKAHNGNILSVMVRHLRVVISCYSTLCAVVTIISMTIPLPTLTAHMTEITMWGQALLGMVGSWLLTLDPEGRPAKVSLIERRLNQDS